MTRLEFNYVGFRTGLAGRVALWLERTAVSWAQGSGPAFPQPMKRALSLTNKAKPFYLYFKLDTVTMSIVI